MTSISDSISSLNPFVSKYLESLLLDGKVGICAGTIKVLDIGTRFVNFSMIMVSQYQTGRSYLRICKLDKGGHLFRKHPSEK